MKYIKSKITSSNFCMSQPHQISTNRFKNSFGKISLICTICFSSNHINQRILVLIDFALPSTPFCTQDAHTSILTCLSPQGIANVSILILILLQMYTYLQNRLTEIQCTSLFASEISLAQLYYIFFWCNKTHLCISHVWIKIKWFKNFYLFVNVFSN